jgi:hypothetical protein
VKDASETVPLAWSEVWARVAKRFPLDDEERTTVSDGRERGLVQWRWATNELARAGWILRDPSSNGDWFPTEAGKAALEEFPDPIDFVTELRTRYNEWDRERKAERRSILTTGIVPQNADQGRIRNVAALYVENGLEAGESVFAPGRQIWNTQTVGELVECFVDAPDPDSDSFVAKLRLQLAHVSDDARLLMAELVCLQLLPVSTLGATAKKQRISDVLGTMDRPVRIPDAVIKAFNGNSFNPGTAMSTGLYEAMIITIRFVEAWLALDSDEQLNTLAEPLKFRDFVFAVPGQNFPTQRNSLCYLLRPDFFGPIVSSAHKSQIRDAFVGEVGESSGDLDADLFAITIALQAKTDGPINFYDHEYEKQWKPRTKPTTTPEDDLDDPVVAVPAAGAFPKATAEFADSLHIDRAWLQEKLDLIERRKQVILYGPPGTGKTYLARKLAQQIAEDAAAVTLVQFHPSYSYEDFFEGFRPATTNGSLSYELKSGPLKRIAEQARRDPERNFVLIIDEINRGNLAKIFGELYFLLEYRDAEVSLLYSQDSSFTLPPNITIIGTMNTSDRSIALMDAAMRRRFAFIELHPQKQPTASVLRRWLGHHKLDGESANLLDALNTQIESDYAVGPSYLMSSDLDVSENRLTDIWKHEILPLLEEHHFGDGIDIEKRYGLKSLRARLQAAEGENEGAETTVNE